MGARKAHNLEVGGANPSSASYTALFKVAGEGIGEVPSDQVQSIKVLRDGVLYIERNGRTYDAQGKRVK